jgi:hypothetical protein
MRLSPETELAMLLAIVPAALVAMLVWFLWG